MSKVPSVVSGTCLMLRLLSVNTVIIVSTLIFQNSVLSSYRNILMFTLYVHQWHINFRLEITMFLVASSK